MKNKLKRDLREGKVRVGTVVTIDSPTVAEILARCGFDWIWIDMEHTPIGFETVQMMLQAMSGYNVTPLVRVAGNDELLVKRVLDVGPHAVVVPFVNTKEDAARAVSYMKYPPEGIRGGGVGRAQGFGLDLEEYLKVANDEVMAIMQIEHINAVNNINEILAVKGVDAVMLGPLDLSGSMGLLGQEDHPDVEAAMQRVLAASKKARIPAGIFVRSPQKANERIAQGFQFIVYAFDEDLLISAAMNILGQVKR
jgi:2-keto-3-deoxy-L-rhamnonate aldolase RhmA